MSFKPEPPDTLPHRRGLRASAPSVAASDDQNAPPSDSTLAVSARPLRPAERPIAQRIATTLAALLLAGYAVMLATLLRPGADDLRLAAVFSTDEALSGEIVWQMLDERTLSPSHFFAYGAVLHEVAAVLALAIDSFTARDTAILLGLRATALLGGVATLVLTYLLGARLFSPAAGLVAAVLLALSAEQARWSITAHPDTLQAAFTTAGLIGVGRIRASPSSGPVALTAAFAGLAFATKYGGVLLLPTILLAAWAGLITAGHPAREVGRRLVSLAFLAGAVFAAVFALTNPYALIEWRRSISQVRAEVAHASQGHVTRATDPGWRWLTLLGAPRALGVVVLLLAPLGWIGTLRGSKRVQTADLQSWPRRVAAVLDPRQLVVLWTAASLSYLVLAIGYQEARYALPIFPALCVFAAGGVTWAARRRPRAATALGVAALLLTAVLAAEPLRRVRNDRLAQRLDADAPAIAAGLWLEQHIAPTTTALTDAYVYIPPRIANRHETFGLTAAQVEATRPVAIVVNEAIRGRFRAPDAGDRYVDGPVAYEERRSAYESLEAGRLGCYAPLRDFGGVTVYADTAAMTSGATQGCGLTGRGNERPSR